MSYTFTYDKESMTFEGPGHSGSSSVIAVPDGGIQMLFNCSCGFEFSTPAIQMPDGGWSPSPMPAIDEAHMEIFMAQEADYQQKKLERVADMLSSMLGFGQAGEEDEGDADAKPKRKPECDACPALPYCEKMGFQD